MRADKDESGFTLVEVLVALVITSMLLGILMNGAVTAKQQVTLATERRQAAALAASLIDAIGVQDLSERAILRGADGKLHWVKERSTVAAEPRRLVGLFAWRVTVFGTDDRRLISVSSRRLLSISPT